MTISLKCGHKNKILMYFAWLVGMLVGFLFAFGNEASARLVMSPVIFSRSSYFGLISVLILPYIISAFVLLLSRPLWLVPIVFLRAFTFGFVYFIVSFAYQEAGWIARILIMFADSISVVLWLWFILGHPTDKSSKMEITLLLFSLVSIVVGVIDYCFISPLTVMLFI